MNHFAPLTEALNALQKAIPGKQRQVRMKRVLRAATDLAAERDLLHEKLNVQWNWLMEQRPDDRDGEPSAEFLQREKIYYKTLDRYQDACDALRAAKQVITP